jgi:predicted hotdog family 3-hydroxylacyl-ACP dehydratase
MPEPLDFPDVRELLPHRGAAVLLDRLVSADEDVARAELTVSERTPFTDGGPVDAVLALEYMAQAVAAHFGLACRGRGEPVRVGYLVGVREATFGVTQFEEGERLSVVARRVFGDHLLAAFECEVLRSREVVATALLSVVLPSSEPEVAS